VKLIPKAGNRAGMGLVGVSNGTGDIMMLNLEPSLLKDAWTKDKTTRVYRHLSNGSKHYVTGWRDATGKTIYRRSKSKPLEKGISWSIGTAYGKAKSPVTMAFYANNENGESRWGGLDFDAHDPQFAERAQRFAFDAFRLLLNIPGLFVILEHSGRGWHCWAVAKEFIPVEKWVVLLKQIAFKIGAVIGGGECEIFPPDSLRSTYGRAMRAPGSWNPSTGECSRLLFDNIDPVLDLKDDLTPYHTTGKIELLPGNDLEPQLYDKREQVSSLFKALWDSWIIRSTSTRNEKLQQLTGHTFWYLGQKVASTLVEKQYQEKAVSTNASLAEHFKEFDLLWAGMVDRLVRELSPKARDAYQQLDTENEREAFKIIRCFAQKADMDGTPDFSIASQNVGLRVGVSYQAICNMRKKFERAGIIRQTQPALPNKRAARYVWLLEESP
jgi:hypothetical protein